MREINRSPKYPGRFKDGANNLRAKLGSCETELVAVVQATGRLELESGTWLVQEGPASEG